MRPGSSQQHLTASFCGSRLAFPNLLFFLGLRVVFGRARKFWKSAAAQIFLCTRKAPPMTVVNDKSWAWEGPGHSGMFWARLSVDDFRLKLEIVSFLSRVMFISKSFFCSPRFCKTWRQTFKPWGFWFRRCLQALFENCAPSLGIFLRTPTTTTSVLFENFFSFFKAETMLFAWQLWWSPGWSKLFGGGSSKT